MNVLANRIFLGDALVMLLLVLFSLIGIMAVVCIAVLWSDWHNKR